MTEQDMLHAPIYLQTAAYARENGERDQYRASHLANVACRAAIDQAIRTHFDGMHLDKAAVQSVIKTFGAERTLFVLANTVQQKSWDGRFSPDNKAWAATYTFPKSDVPGFDARDSFAATAHPAVLDGFISLARSEAKRAREKPSVKQQLHAAPQRTAVAPRQTRQTRSEVR